MVDSGCKELIFVWYDVTMQKTKGALMFCIVSLYFFSRDRDIRLNLSKINKEQKFPFVSFRLIKCTSSGVLRGESIHILKPSITWS